MSKNNYPIKRFSDLANSKSVTGASYKAAGFIALAIVLSVLVIYLQPSAKSHRKPVMDVDQSSNTNALLSQNLHFLRDQARRSSSKRALPVVNHPLMSGVELTARYNAPMEMYHSTDSQAMNKAASAPILQQQSTMADFVNRKTYTASVRAQRIQHADYTIVSGELLHAVLESSIQSDLPGQIRAFVSSPVYSYIGQRILVPKGSRLIGQYHTASAMAQRRVMVVWNRLVLPNGISVQIDSGGVDDQGLSGQGADSINRHFWQRFGQASLLSLIGAGAATASVSDYDQYNSLAQYRTGIAQAFEQSANQSLQSDTHTKPTLYINAGANINVFVARDIDFYNVVSGS